jgi:hypothetical protein
LRKVGEAQGVGPICVEVMLSWVTLLILA